MSRNVQSPLLQDLPPTSIAARFGTDLRSTGTFTWFFLRAPHSAFQLSMPAKVHNISKASHRHTTAGSIFQASPDRSGEAAMTDVSRIVRQRIESIWYSAPAGSSPMEAQWRGSLPKEGCHDLRKLDIQKSQQGVGQVQEDVKGVKESAKGAMTNPLGK